MGSSSLIFLYPTKTDNVYNEANQITKASTKSFAVDVNGNVTNDGRYEYVWNAFNQLTEVKTMAGTTVATYKYDENGRRIYSKVDRKETYYRYDGTSNHVLFEENAKGEITKAYTYDDNGKPLTMTYGDETYYYLTNYRGDVLALTNESGAVVAEYTYDAWGNILTQKDLDQEEDVNLAKENPYRYAGYHYDEETKLYYLMARYYNPDTGVFLSLDPVRGDTMTPITMNGYNYANNNPVMNVDPDGNLSRKLQYSVITGLGFVISELIGGISFTAILSAVGAAFSAYSSHIRKNKLNSYSKIMSDMKYNSGKHMKNLKKEALKVALKMGIRTLIPVSYLSVAWYFSRGMYYAYTNYNKYKSYSMLNFAKKIEGKYN